MFGTLGTVGAVGRENRLAFVGGERTAPGASGESEQRLEVLRFCGDLGREEGFLLPSDLFLEQLDVEEHDPRAVVRFAVVLHESLIGDWGGERLLAHKLQFAPQSVDLRPARVVEQEPTQRLVLAAVQEHAPLGVSRDDQLKENRRWEQRAKFRSRPGSFGGDARMYDLRGQRVARRRFGDRLGQSPAAARGSDQESLDGGRFRTGFIEAHVGAEESRQRERLLQLCRQVLQIDDDLGTGSRHQSGPWHWPPLRVLAEFESGRLLDGRAQLGMLRKHQRRPVTAFQSQPVPNHERVGLGWQRDHPEERLTGGPLNPLAGDHATQILPRGKAVADRECRIFAVVALEQLVLHGLDRRQDRCRISGGRSPFFSHEGEHVGRQTGVRQTRGHVAQISQCLPQVRSRDMQQLERDPIATGWVSIGDSARDHQLGRDRTRPGDSHGSFLSGMHEERSRGQCRPGLDWFRSRVHEDRRFGTKAPRFQFGPSRAAVAPFGEERRSGGRFQEAPAGLVLVRPGVPLQQIGHQFGDAPGSLIAGCFADRPFDERAVGPVVFVRKHGQEEQFAALNRDPALEGNRARFRDFGLREDTFRRGPLGLDLLLGRLESRLPPLLLGFNLGRFLLPLNRQTIDFRRRGRLSAEPGPECRQISRVELFLGGNSGDVGGAATGEPITVLQGRREMRPQRRLTVGAGMAGVEAAERFESLLGPIRALGGRGEAKARGQQHGPRGNVASGQVVAFDQTGSHRHRVADVRKPLAANAVGGKLASPRRPHVDAGEIADRVVVLGVAQPSQRHRTGVAGPRGGFRIERRRDPAHQLFPLGRGRLRRILRRHVAQTQPLGDVTEHLGLGEDRLGRPEAREIEIVVPGFLPVTVPAGYDEQRVDLPDIRLPEIVLTLGRGRDESEARQHREREPWPTAPGVKRLLQPCRWARCQTSHTTSHQIRSLWLSMCFCSSAVAAATSPATR